MIKRTQLTREKRIVGGNSRFLRKLVHHIGNEILGNTSRLAAVEPN